MTWENVLKQPKSYKEQQAELPLPSGYEKYMSPEEAKENQAKLNRQKQESTIKALESDIFAEDTDAIKEKLETQVTDVMASILNEYDVGASNDSFHMPTVSEGLKKIFQAMSIYAEGSNEE